MSPPGCASNFNHLFSQKNHSLPRIDRPTHFVVHQRTQAFGPQRVTKGKNKQMTQQLQSQRAGVQFGKYTVLSRLATGGMAELFLAREEGVAGISKTVVLKCVLPHLAQKDEFLTMFLDEARVATHLSHPNIVQIHEVGAVKDVYYIAMEYIRGFSVKEFRQKVFALEEFAYLPPWGLFAGVAQQVAAGLDYAHNALDDVGNPLGIIHRDISHNNLLVSCDGIVKIVDFGVAKAATQEHKTRVGMLKGRLSYMSPEQLSNEALTPASDLFSLGVVLHEMCTNQRLFKRDAESAVVSAILTDPIPSPREFQPTCPSELEAIIMKALARDPAARYQSAAHMRVDLEQFMQQNEYYGPQHIGDFIATFFPEERNKLMAKTTQHINLKELEYLAFRTGSFQVGAFSDFSSPQDFEDFLPQQDPTTPQLTSGSGASSYDFEYAATDDPTLQTKPPRKILWATLFVAFVALTTLGFTQLHRLQQWLSTQPPSAQRIQLQRKHRPKLENLLEQGQFQNAFSYLYALQNKPEGTILKPWIAQMHKRIQLKSRLASVRLLYQQRDLKAAQQVLKGILIQYPGSEEVRAWFKRIQQAQKDPTKQLPSLSREGPPPIDPAPAQRTKTTRKKRRKRRKNRKKRRIARAAITPRPRALRPTPPRPIAEKKGALFINSTPRARVELNGTLLGYTPINGKKIKPGPYILKLSRPGYRNISRNIRIQPDKPVDLSVELRSLKTPRPRPLRPTPVAPKRPTPRKSNKPRPRLPFSAIRLPRKKRLILLAVDPRGILGRFYSQRHAKLCRQIEREVARVLGPAFPVKDVTVPWQRYIRSFAIRRRKRKLLFYPRAAAYLIYRNFSRGRSKTRVAQLLLLYQRRNRFRKYLNR